ncbi:zinc finger protein 107-like [Sitodiplosis mosellana]|uniref:zinc finger protein 107-like n=1 Tax=Sitodiplosis mosellana TaxID=263140 RepID=UPI0024439D06|nr:zinc finger protein 107-like [Sitodiplosis mosellana]
MTSMDNLIAPQFAAIKQDNVIGDWFHCQFCPMSFGMYDEYKAHTFGHFSTQTCTGCNVRLIQICDKWFEVHTVANCQNNHHVHTFNTNNAGHNDNGEIMVIKQEPPAEMEAAQLDELLNVKPDVDLDDFGEIFAANLNTIEMSENNGGFDTTQQHQNSNDISQLNYQVVSITVKEKHENKRTKGFQCRFCDKVVLSRFRLDSHIQSHHMDNKTSCKHCGRNFTSFQRLDNHVKRCTSNNKKRPYLRSHPHRPTENFTCDLCGSVLKKFRTLFDHMNEVHSSKFTFKCRICQRKYPSRYYLTKHLNRHKQAFENRLANDASNVGDLDEHLMERRKYARIHPHRPAVDFTCDICGKAISRFDMLEEHMSISHSARDSFQCNICLRTYPNRYFLQKHKARHKNAAANGIEMLEEDLDKGLMERNKYHRLAPGERRSDLTCDECGREFKHHYLLMEHKTSKHSGESVFECRKCGRFYPNRYYLTKHMKRHEEAEKCGIPEDQLPQDLDVGLMERAKYVRADRNERKTVFDCDECSRSFNKFCLLTEHKRSRHGYGLSCRKCNRSFASRKKFAKHMKRHDQEISAENDRNPIEHEPYVHTNVYAYQPKPEYVCNSCGLKYNTHELLKLHMASNHSNHLNTANLEIIEIQHNLSIKPESHEKVEEEIEEGVEEIVKEEEKIEKEEEERGREKNGARRRKMEKQNRKEKEQHDNSDEDLVQREYLRAHPHRPASNFTCEICQKVLSTYYSIKLHMRSRHTRKVRVKHPCPKCNKEFVSKIRLEKHRISKHPNVPDAPLDAPAEASKSKGVESKQMCSICGRLFPDKSKMIAHEKTHLGIMTSCNICGKKFMHKTYLRKHIMGVHTNERPFACGIDGCEWRFSYQPCLKRHQARRHGLVNNPNQCPICGKCFPDSTYHLKRHLKAHANNTAKEYFPEPTQDPSQPTTIRFECDYCAEKFASRAARINHTLTHFQNKNCFTCNKMMICISGDWYALHASAECDKENIDTPNVIDVDVKTEAIDYTQEDAVSLKSEANEYACSAYSDDTREDNIFEQSPVHFQSHIEVSSLPEIVIPPVVKQKEVKQEPMHAVTRKPRIVSKPISKIETPTESTNETDIKPARRQRKKVIYKATFLDHRPKASCICDVCNKTLGTFSSLRNHILNMHCESERSERVSCDECGQTFSTPGNLNSHKKIHLKCKAYVCTYCGRGFNQLHNLKEHQNRHTGEKPYKCERCGKTFGRKTNLTAHTRVHTGAKPFKCNIEGCDRAYMFEIDLKRHKYSIHGIFTKKHICPICSKVYPENKLLKKHLDSHSTGNIG